MVIGVEPSESVNSYSNPRNSDDDCKSKESSDGSLVSEHQHIFLHQEAWSGLAIPSKRSD
jgi:hypothetical protein